MAPRHGWRRAKLVAGTLALTMGAFGTVAAVTALPAFAAVTSNPYTIGTPSGAVNSVTVSPTTGLSGTATSYTVTFISPGAVASGGTVTIGDSTTNNSVASTASGVTLVSGTCLQSGGNANGTSGTVITLNSSSCSAGIAAGATVSVGFSATNPTANFNFAVATSANSTRANSPTVTISSSPPTVSAASLSLGVNTTYTISSVGATTASKASWSTLTGTASVLQVTASSANLIFSNSGAASYSVTYTPSGGTASTDVVTGVTGGGTNSVQLTLTTAIASGGVVNITALGTNPATSVGNSAVTMTVTPGNVSSSVFTANGTALTTSNSLDFGTAVTAVTLAVSPLVSGASATYTLTFKATNAVPVGGTISLTETAGPTSFTGISGVLVSNATSNWRQVTTTPGSGSGLTIVLANAIAAGDALTVTVAGVTNPGAGTYTDFTVSTSVDTVPVSAPSYTISASGTAGVTVVPNPNTVGSLATYTITGLFASSAITGGTTGSPANYITLTAPAGTVFPNSAGSYVITDSTTASGSGTVGTIIWNSPGTSVTIVPPNSITSGDALTITIADVINPSTSSSAYTITIGGPVNGQTGVAPFPRANVTYPNGALINFAGTIYVFAGGHGFGIPTPTVLNKIRAVDPAVPLNAPAGAVPPTAGSRSGTLISTYAVNGNATIYVVGTDGEVHGFSTPKQLISFGYDTRTNVTTNNLGGMTVGSTEGQLGAAKGNAYATSSDGAIIDSSGTYFTFVGGRAFGIPTPARLAQIMDFYTKHSPALTPPTTLTGTISSTQTSASVASGVMPSVSPPPTSSVTNATVYATFVGNVFPFKTPTQLKNDGYGGTAALPAVNTGGLPVVTTYTSS
jgi:hypothetical protein